MRDAKAPGGRAGFGQKALQVQSIRPFFVRLFVCSFLPSFSENFHVGGRGLASRELTCRGDRADQEPCPVPATGDSGRSRKKLLIPLKETCTNKEMKNKEEDVSTVKT